MKRRYATHYYHSIHDRQAAAISHGACITEENAVRASVFHVVCNRFAKCEIVDRKEGVVVSNVKRTASGDIKVNFGRA